MGDVRAMANVGIINLQNGKTKDELELAIEFIKKSANEGIFASQNSLGWAYETG